ncbi:hypothetical protein LDC_0917, partial [sediment metagenome]
IYIIFTLIIFEVEINIFYLFIQNKNSNVKMHIFFFYKKMCYNFFMEDVIKRIIFYIQKITNFDEELSKNFLIIFLFLVIIIS